MKPNLSVGVIASSWLLVLLVIASELSEPFKTLLKNAFSHHWIGKTVIVTLVFIVCSYALGKKKNLCGMPAEKCAWYSAVGSIAVIMLFFVAMDLAEG